MGNKRSPGCACSGKIDDRPPSDTMDQVIRAARVFLYRMFGMFLCVMLLWCLDDGAVLEERGGGWKWSGE